MESGEDDLFWDEGLRITGDADRLYSKIMASP